MLRILATGAVCALSFASVPGPSVAQDADAGRQTFRTYCVTCHGMEGRGDGPMTQVLTIVPPDLTRLTSDNEGTFPISRVVARIDGRMPLLGHGGPMPVFGDLFEGESSLLDSETGAPIMTSQTMVDVVSYIEGLQR